MAKLKVFYGKYYTGDPRVQDPQRPWISQFDCAIATTSQKRASLLARTPVSQIQNYWSAVPVKGDMHNARGNWAVAHPERVWVWRDDFSDTAEGAVDLTERE